MIQKWMCLLCCVLCLLAGCGQEELYTCPLPRDVDGTVTKVDEANKEILVEITSPEELWSYEGEKKVDCLLEKGDVVLTGYDGEEEFYDFPPKVGMYVRVIFSDDTIETREDFEEKDGYLYIDSDSVHKNISFVDGKWSEGTYD